MRKNLSLSKFIFAGVLLLLGIEVRAADGAALGVEEYVMSLRSQERDVLTDGVLLIRSEDQWLYPGEDTIKAMGFFVEGSADSGVLQGYVRSETLPYKIDAKTCDVYLSGKAKKFPCESFSYYDGVWYVDEPILRHLFDVRLDLDEKKSLVTVLSSKTLPAIQQQKIKDNQTAIGRESEQLPLETSPYEWLDGVNLFQRYENQNIKTGSTGKTSNQSAHDLYLRSEVAMFSLKSNVRGVNDSYESDWFSLSRSDPQRAGDPTSRMTYFEMGNLQTYTTPYLRSTGKLTGVNFNNRDLERATNFLTQDFQGELRTGWYLEIYRNDVLVATTEPNENQRYLVQGVPLVLGLNRIHLIFYGPFGNIEHRYESYLVDESMLSSKKIEYNVAVGETEAGEQDHYLNLDTRVGRTNLLSLYYKQDDATRFQTDFKGIAFDSAYTFTQAQSSDGSLVGVSTNTNFDSTNVFTRLTNYNGYVLFNDSRDVRLDKEIFVGLNANMFRGLLVGLDHLYELDVEDRSTNKLINRLGFGRSNFYAGNVVSWEKEADRYDGEAFLRFTHRGVLTHRVSNNYTQERSSDKISWQTSYDRPEGRFRVALERTYAPDVDWVLASAEKNFRRFLGFGTVSANSENDLAITIGIGSLLTYDKKTNRAEVMPERNIETSQLVARAFLDLNENGEHDEGEPLLQDIEFKNGQTRLFAQTDEDGNAMFYGLQSWLRTRVEVVVPKIQNIYYRPTVVAKDIYLRGGKTAHIDFPFIVRGEVYGVISSKYDGDRYLVQVIKGDEVLASSKAERDGYYLVEDVPLRKDIRVRVLDRLTNRYVRSEEVAFTDTENPSIELNLGVEN